jgi:hypothetical protein
VSNRQIGLRLREGGKPKRCNPFRDIVGKLDVLNIDCEKCGRRGRYHVHRLVERYG